MTAPFRSWRRNPVAWLCTLRADTGFTGRTKPVNVKASHAADAVNNLGDPVATANRRRFNPPVMKWSARTAPMVLSLGCLLATTACGSPRVTTPSASSPNQPASSCSPQPCGSSGGLTVYVTGLIHVPTAPGLVEATFTVANHDTVAHDLSGALDTYSLQAGDQAAVTDNDASSLGVLADGSACQDDQASLPPGADSPTLHTCFVMTGAQIADSLKFIWSISSADMSAGGTIDLSGLSMQ
jgi:hypothetical protein